MPAQTVILTVSTVRRLRNSRNGNPRFSLTTDDGLVLSTRADASINYEIENLTGPSLDRVGPFYVTLDGRGQVIDLRR